MFNLAARHINKLLSEPLQHEDPKREKSIPLAINSFCNCQGRAVILTKGNMCHEPWVQTAMTSVQTLHLRT